MEAVWAALLPAAAAVAALTPYLPRADCSRLLRQLRVSTHRGAGGGGCVGAGTGATTDRSATAAGEFSSATG